MKKIAIPGENTFALKFDGYINKGRIRFQAPWSEQRVFDVTMT